MKYRESTNRIQKREELRQFIKEYLADRKQYSEEQKIKDKQEMDKINAYYKERDSRDEQLRAKKQEQQEVKNKVLEAVRNHIEIF